MAKNPVALWLQIQYNMKCICPVIPLIQKRVPFHHLFCTWLLSLFWSYVNTYLRKAYGFGYLTISPSRWIKQDPCNGQLVILNLKPPNSVYTYQGSMHGENSLVHTHIQLLKFLGIRVHTFCTFPCHDTSAYTIYMNHSCPLDWRTARGIHVIMCMCRECVAGNLLHPLPTKAWVRD